MLQRLDKLRGWTVEASDGEVGKVKDFFFDDDRWVVRYFLVDAGSWLGRDTLVSPLSVNNFDFDRKRFRLSLTRSLIKGSPVFEDRQRLSRRWEATYAGYYKYPYYWGSTGLWGAEESPEAFGRTAPSTYSADKFSNDEFRQRRVSEVLGFHIRALDGEVGHIDDFLADTNSWKIRYLLADTSNFIGGKWVLISPDWTRRVDWNGLTVNVDMNSNEVKNAPEFDPDRMVDRDYELKLHDYYHRPTYWR